MTELNQSFCRWYLCLIGYNVSFLLIFLSMIPRTLVLSGGWLLVWVSITNYFWVEKKIWINPIKINNFSLNHIYSGNMCIHLYGQNIGALPPLKKKKTEQLSWLPLIANGSFTWSQWVNTSFAHCYSREVQLKLVTLGNCWVFFFLLYFLW